MQLASRPTVLICDEPTNHLSVSLVDELTAALSNTSAAVVVATHDRQKLTDLAGWSHLSLTAQAINDETPLPASSHDRRGASTPRTLSN